MGDVTARGQSLFGVPVCGGDEEYRVVSEHEIKGEYLWAISRTTKRIKEQFPNRPVAAECEFNLIDLVNLASLAIAGDPRICDDKHSGRKLAAGFLMLAQKSGLVDLGESEQE